MSHQGCFESTGLYYCCCCYSYHYLNLLNCKFNGSVRNETSQHSALSYLDVSIVFGQLNEGKWSCRANPITPITM